MSESSNVWIVRKRTRRSQAPFEKNETYLKQLANEYSKEKRTDDKAMEVFEQVINPNCELRWLQTLAMIYIVRQQWGKLKHLAEQLEQRNMTL